MNVQAFHASEKSDHGFNPILSENSDGVKSMRLWPLPIKSRVNKHRAAGLQSGGLEFEAFRSYPICVALAPTHRFARLKSITLEKVAAEPLIGFSRKDYREYYVGLDRIFGPLGIKPRVVVECDSASSLITEVETGRGIAVASPILKHASGKQLLYRPLIGTTEVLSVGIARAINGDVTPAAEKFCEFLRKNL
jgi:DNA-binding transcriptional LysR family regulator